MSYQLEERFFPKEEKTWRINKKINFNQVVSAILIPSIKDMDPEIMEKLWWNKIDYLLFSKSANNEIAAFLKIHKDLTRKDAIRLLYDHSIICYEPI